MSIEDNKVLLRHFYEALNTQGAAAFDQFCDSSYVDHALPPGVPQNLDGAKMSVSMLTTAFADLHTMAEDVVADGDKVVARISCSGTQTGDFMGLPPTGKHVQIEAFDMFRVADGKLVEHWSRSDALGMMQQLGLIPSSSQVEA